MISFKIITAYPDMFPGVLGYSVIGKALQEKKWSLEVINLHDFGHKTRNNIDDMPFGGGPGMIMRPDVIEKAVNFAKVNFKNNCQLIYMSSRGNPLKQQKLRKFSKFLTFSGTILIAKVNTFEPFITTSSFPCGNSKAL